MNLNDKDAVMQNNENDGETCADVVNQNQCESDGDDNGGSYCNLNNSDDSDASDYESFHDEMDWYHVLNSHGCQREKELLFQLF